MLKVSETYIIGVDIAKNGDESVVQIVKQIDRVKGIVVNTLTGTAAEQFYNNFLKGEQNNEI